MDMPKNTFKRDLIFCGGNLGVARNAPDGHGEIQCDFIAGFPFARDGGKPVLRRGGDFLAVHAEGPRGGRAKSAKRP